MGGRRRGNGGLRATVGRRCWGVRVSGDNSLAEDAKQGYDQCFSSFHIEIPFYSVLSSFKGEYAPGTPSGVRVSAEMSRPWVVPLL